MGHVLPLHTTNTQGLNLKTITTRKLLDSPKILLFVNTKIASGNKWQSHCLSRKSAMDDSHQSPFVSDLCQIYFRVSIVYSIRFLDRINDPLFDRTDDPLTMSNRFKQALFECIFGGSLRVTDSQFCLFAPTSTHAGYPCGEVTN